MILQFILFAIFANFSVISGIKVSSNGGYSLVLGIDEDSPEPQNLQIYLNQIQNNLHSFSNHLYTSSRKYFYLNSVDILIPSSWNYETAEQTFETYTTSDIKLSEQYTYPRVENPNSCVISGHFIELPFGYFAQGTSEQFGDISKSLLPKWARYRWGVWEEHGYPGDSRFPYFTKILDHTQHKWVPTGCWDTEINGVYQNINTNETCENIGLEAPEEDCRFVPDLDTNLAKSSLMHYHWLDSVQEFCDDDTHINSAPNRQNIFCNHQSVWSVIRMTEDYAQVTEPQFDVEPSVPVFRVVKQAQKPLLYILLDSGRNELPTTVLPDLKSALKNLIENDGLGIKTFASLGIYPNENLDKITSSGIQNLEYVQEIISFQNVQNGKEHFSQAFDEHLTPQGSSYRDFGQALQEIGVKFQIKNYSPGAIILIVKTGSGERGFDSLTYESEVLEGLKSVGNLRIYAIETKGVRKEKPYLHLENLVQGVGGQYHAIVNEFGVEKKLKEFFDNLKEDLQSPIIPNESKTNLLFKGPISPSQDHQFQIMTPGLQYIDIIFTTSGIVNVEDLTLETFGHDVTTNFIKSSEYSETFDITRRSIFTLRTTPPITTPDTWTFSYTCRNSVVFECSGHLLVSGLSDPSFVPENDEKITTYLWTSAPSNLVDMSQFWPRPSPFSIFAKIQLNYEPLKKLSSVYAQITGENGQLTIIQLFDDGFGSSDVQSDDGIYSGSFISENDGFYKISLQVLGYDQMNPVESTLLRNFGSNSTAKLLPIDQKDIDCVQDTLTCSGGSKYTGTFQIIQDYPSPVKFINSRTFPIGTPEKILDFKVVPGERFNMYFYWTAPRIYGESRGPQQYTIYMSNRLTNSIGHFDFIFKIVMTLTYDPPGTKLAFRYNAARDSTVYYVIEALTFNEKGDLSSGPSNVAGGVVAFDDARPSTTTTTTPVTTTTELLPETPTSAPITFPSTTDTTSTTTSRLPTIFTFTTTKGPTTSTSTTLTPPSSTSTTTTTQIPDISTENPDIPTTTTPTIPESTLNPIPSTSTTSKPIEETTENIEEPDTTVPTNNSPRFQNLAQLLISFLTLVVIFI